MAKVYFYVMCMSVLPACTSVYHLHAWCLERPGEDGSCCATGVTDGRESLCGFCRQNLGSLKEHQTLVTPESRLFGSKFGIFNILSVIDR